MDLKKIKNGTFLTMKRTHDTPIYIEVSRVDIGKKVIKIWDQKVHSFLDDDTYMGCDHFQDPYTFSMEEFNKKVSITDLYTIKKIQKSFKKDGEKVCILPSQSDIDANYKKMKIEMKRKKKLWKEMVKEKKRAEKEKKEKKIEEKIVKILDFMAFNPDGYGTLCPWSTDGIPSTSKEDPWPNPEDLLS